MPSLPVRWSIRPFRPSVSFVSPPHSFSPSISRSPFASSPLPSLLPSLCLCSSYPPQPSIVRPSVRPPIAPAKRNHKTEAVIFWSFASDVDYRTASVVGGGRPYPTTRPLRLPPSTRPLLWSSIPRSSAPLGFESGRSINHKSLIAIHWSFRDARGDEGCFSGDRWEIGNVYRVRASRESGPEMNGASFERRRISNFRS